MDAQIVFDRLLHAESEQQVDTILNAAGYSLDNEAVWQPLGGMENNFSTVGNQQTEATAAFVEKIINGIDANLMAECFSENINPESEAAPSDMQSAVQQWPKPSRRTVSNRPLCGAAPQLAPSCSRRRRHLRAAIRLLVCVCPSGPL